MAKDLPYFKFFCSEWSDGDITLEDYDVQGLFVNICAYYWSNECNLDLIKLKKRFKSESKNIDLLIKNNLIKVGNNIVSISFLDEQKKEREDGSKVKSKAGKASAEAKKLAKLQQEVNTTLTENQHMLSFCSTESQLLRKEERREEKKREDNINNAKFSSEIKVPSQWSDTIGMQNKIDFNCISIYLDHFDAHLVVMQEQKESLKDYKEHFSNWLRKQDLSAFRVKSFGKTNQI